MVYEEIVSLDDLLVFAHLSDRVDDLTEIMGKPIPLWYGVTFYFKKKDKQSETKDKAWSAIFKIRVTDETPELFSVEISGVKVLTYSR